MPTSVRPDRSPTDAADVKSDRHRNPATRIDNDLISEHLQRIFVQIHRRVRNVEDARELTQEVFIRALRHDYQLRDQQKVSHWLSRIATNITIDFLRRRREYICLEEASSSGWKTCEDPEQIAGRAQDRRVLNRALENLSERERTALVLRDVNELPSEEVATIMNCSQATVRSHIANARIKLRRFFAAANAFTKQPG